MNARVRGCARVAGVVGLVRGWSACTSEPAATESTTTIEINNVTGTVRTLAERSLDDAFDASKEALEELQFNLGRADKDAAKGVLLARTVENDNTTLGVILNRVSNNIT